MESAIVIIILIIIFIGVLAVFGVFSSPPPRQTKRNVVSSKTPPQNSGFESLLTILAVGAAGFVAYKVLQAVIEEAGKMQINVNGKYQSIATAAKNDSFIGDLLREIAQKKLENISQRSGGLDDVSENPHKAAEDIAQMLRDALEARMRREGL